jgi:hypothetical protein
MLCNSPVSPDSIPMPRNNRNHGGLALCFKIKRHTERLQQTVHSGVFWIGDTYLRNERADVLGTDEWAVGGEFTLVDAENESCHI